MYIILQNFSLKSTFSPFCDYFNFKKRTGYSTLHPEKESAFIRHYTFADRFLYLPQPKKNMKTMLVMGSSGNDFPDK